MTRYPHDRSPHPHRAFYDQLLTRLKERIRAAQIQAALSVNRELVILYWRIGQDILQRQADQGWGSKVIDRLAEDLRRDLSNSRGFSSRNLRYMRAFAEAYPDESLISDTLANLPWGHNVRLLDALETTEERLWYAQQAIAQGWSRNILLLQIENSSICNRSRAPSP
ncbi:MAG: DUF1016 domain-containing protein, partial [Leptolyngbya sp. RL_3_1]|nr:DUF1016 domain-containing protein [Leptolyngbya sp. RL_3_1]